ncbi:MAG: inositol monophosphatase [Candidatus Kuenenia sp.]|uniref:inositol monophosphatase family protein n=1 Tax=Candidatus Kuenenia sp. TaxID=2499824 RepID=UPI0022C8C4E6|nr:inositol monophosphatase family protein [Candidatus Kuenenia sp.]MCZ7623608.1 inositol monophosphatase [Candidatus Kuenenia sp.]
MMKVHPNTLAAYLEVAKQAAMEAGDVLKKYFRKLDASMIEEKAANDFVTDVDRRSEQIIKNHIITHFSDHAILAEESETQTNTSPFLWIIDPLDGTANYIHGVPAFAISIALEIKGELCMGIVYDPIKADIFSAVKGQGASKNGKPIHVSLPKNLNDSLIATGFPFRKKNIVDTYVKIFRELLNHASDMRRCGSASLDLAYTADGIFSGFFEYALSPWDIAAGALLVQEAGGITTDFNGKNNYLKTGNIIAGSKIIHNELLKIIQSNDPNYFEK